MFLGLGATTVTLLHGDGIAFPFVPEARATLLAGAVLWSAALAWRIGGIWAGGWRRVAVVGSVAASAGLPASAWITLFWVW